MRRCVACGERERESTQHKLTLPSLSSLPPSDRLDGPYADTSLEWLLDHSPTGPFPGGGAAAAAAVAAATAPHHDAATPAAGAPSPTLPLARPPTKRRRSDGDRRRGGGSRDGGGVRGAAGRDAAAAARAATGPRPNLPDAMRLLDGLPCGERALLVEAAALCAPPGGAPVAPPPQPAPARARARAPARPPPVATAATPGATPGGLASRLAAPSPLDLAALLAGAPTPPAWRAHASAELTLAGGHAAPGGGTALFKGLSADYSSALSAATAADDVLRLGLGGVGP